MTRRIPTWITALFLVLLFILSHSAEHAAAEPTPWDSGLDNAAVSIGPAQSYSRGVSPRITTASDHGSSRGRLSPAQENSPAASAATLTLDKLRNAEYYSKAIDVRSVPLKDGSYEATDDTEGSLAGTYWIGDQMAFGDLDGDGIRDAAVVLVSSGGGSASFYELIAVLNVNGKPVQAASAFLGDRVNVRGLAIKPGRIVVDRSRHAPNDPLCCPSMRVTETYFLVGDKLIPSR